MMNTHEMALKWRNAWGNGKMSKDEFAEFRKEVINNKLKSSEVIKEMLHLAEIPIVGQVADLVLELEFVDLLNELREVLDIDTLLSEEKESNNC